MGDVAHNHHNSSPPREFFRPMAIAMAEAPTPNLLAISAIEIPISRLNTQAISALALDTLLLWPPDWISSALTPDSLHIRLMISSISELTQHVPPFLPIPSNFSEQNTVSRVMVTSYRIPPFEEPAPTQHFNQQQTKRIWSLEFVHHTVAFGKRSKLASYSRFGIILAHDLFQIYSIASRT